MSTPIVKPFRALRAVAAHADAVSSPPYDVMNTEEARALAAGNADSFLHVSKPQIDFPPTADANSAEVQTSARAALDRLVATGRLRRDESAQLSVYRVSMGDHVQTGIVAAASVDAYRDGRIKRHEHVNAEKVERRARNADALNAHTGTLFLTYRADDEIDARIQRLVVAAPDVDLEAADGTRHTLWRIDESDDVTAVCAAFNAMPEVYIADGHHRSAAAQTLSQWRGERRAAGEEVAAADWFLAVLFPDDQVKILAYNRVVATLGERSPEEFLDALRTAFRVETAGEPVEPDRQGVFGLYLDARWFRLEIRPDLVPSDALGRLDVNVLERHCLAPLLGISDQRSDARIDFVGGIRGLRELERRVDSGAMKAAFSFYPTRLADMFDVADAGQVMPPKSTWFEPKLRDGLVILPVD